MNSREDRDNVLTAKERAIVLLVLEVTGQVASIPTAGESRASRSTITPPGLDELTPRELEVLPRLLAGATTKQIAIELALSPKTVTSYRVRILHKLGARSSMQLSHLFHGESVEMLSPPDRRSARPNRRH